jgi:hypothetical protein
VRTTTFAESTSYAGFALAAVIHRPDSPTGLSALAA